MAGARRGRRIVEIRRAVKRKGSAQGGGDVATPSPLALRARFSEFPIPFPFYPRRGQSIKIDIGKPIDKSITIDKPQPFKTSCHLVLLLSPNFVFGILLLLAAILDCKSSFRQVINKSSAHTFLKDFI